MQMMTAASTCGTSPAARRWLRIPDIRGRCGRCRLVLAGRYSRLVQPTTQYGCGSQLRPRYAHAVEQWAGGGVACSQETGEFNEVQWAIRGAGGNVPDEAHSRVLHQVHSAKFVAFCWCFLVAQGEMRENAFLYSSGRGKEISSLFNH